MEYIPKEYQKNDLPVAATFISNYAQHEVCLVPSQGKKDENTGVYEKVEGIGLKIRFHGFRIQITNKKMMQLLMETNDYRRGIIRPDPEDPTGFWRQTGLVEIVPLPVAFEGKMGQPSFDTVDFKKLKVPAEDEKIEPIRQVRA